MDQTITTLLQADKTIKTSHNYPCGIDYYSVKCNEDRTKCRAFFDSQDGQNGQLYYELKKLGFRNSGYNSEYSWKVQNGDHFISYTEGDIYIYPFNGSQN